MKLKKLNSGSLQFVVFISIIIALLLAGIILYSYTHRFFIEQSTNIINNIQLADSGINYLTTLDEPSADTIPITIPNADNNQSVKVHHSQWGIFYKAYTETRHGHKKFTKCALLGTCKAEKISLYLKDNYIPLALAGNTLIKGKAFLPEEGVKSGNIGGNSFFNNRFIEGKIAKSDNKLPELQDSYLDNFKYYTDTYKPEVASYININSKKIINSFTQPVKGYYSNDDIILTDKIIQGNIIIKSATKIIVNNSTILKDIILTAPVIEIKEGTKGNFQAIASKSINIEKNCYLNYPSALLLLPSKENIDPGKNAQHEKQIFIGESTIIKGSIGYFHETDLNDYKTKIYISEKSTVHGEVYCMGNLEHKGTIYGSVYTGHFVLNHSSIMYLNHLYNAEINSEKLPENFCGIHFKNQTVNIAKWLY